MAIYYVLALQAASGSSALAGDSDARIFRQEIVPREDSPGSGGVPPEISSAAASIMSIVEHVAKQASGDKSSLLSEVQEEVAKVTSKAAGKHAVIDTAVTPALTAAAGKVTSVAGELQKDGHSGVLEYADSNMEKATAKLKGGSSGTTESDVGSASTEQPGGTSGTAAMTTNLKKPLGTRAVTSEASDPEGGASIRASDTRVSDTASKRDLSDIKSAASRGTNAVGGAVGTVTSDAGKAADTAKSGAKGAASTASEEVSKHKSDASTLRSDASKATSAADKEAHKATSDAGEAASTAAEEISKHKTDAGKITSATGGAVRTATSDAVGAISTASQDISKHKSGSDDGPHSSGASNPTQAASKRNVWNDIQSGWGHFTGKAEEDWEHTKWQTVNADGKRYCVKDSTSLPYTTSNDIKVNTRYGICASTPNGAPVATLTAEPMQTTMQSTIRSAGSTA